MEYIGKAKKTATVNDFYSGHLSGTNKKKINKILLIVLSTVLILSIIIFPYDVGSIFGYWISQLISGFKSHF